MALTHLGASRKQTLSKDLEAAAGALAERSRSVRAGGFPAEHGSVLS